ncbi:hypothetical protein D5S18_06125 [Nocardia panacis]|uniref:HEAT repeat domain-containing protein n=1 Tax=Nocardia panacis TaxID=2340916 RepID=A0A3A4KGK1_9NOCA|nr:hypothetical protein [Nocardia panacis]RJO78454.1 hypothetical protein D5S18_06125 [Nocardia panacis]
MPDLDNQIDRIDWAALDDSRNDQRGSVPQLLRAALAGNGDAFHKLYGIVYADEQFTECLYALLPFLVEIARRHHGADWIGLVLERIAFAAGVTDKGHQYWSPGEEERIEIYAWRRRARDLAAPVVPDVVYLLGSDDESVRNETVNVLIACADRSDEAIVALQRHHHVEAMSIAGRMRFEAGLSPDSTPWLTRHLAGLTDSPDILETLSHLLYGDPEALPGGIVPVVLDAVARLGDIPPLWVAAINGNLGNRLPERTQLLTGLMASSDPAVRKIAAEGAAEIVSRWRGDHRGVLEVMLAAQDDPDEQVRAAAPLNIGAAIEPIADLVMTRFQPPHDPVRSTENGRRYIPTEFVSVAATGDPRIVPIARRILEDEVARDHPQILGNLDRVVNVLGDRAKPLAGLVQRRVEQVLDRPLDDYYEVLDLASALSGLGDPASLPVFLDLLDRGAPPREVLDMLGRLGPAAIPAAPRIRELFDEHRQAAAWALWCVTGAAGPMVELARDYLISGEWRLGAWFAGRAGPAAASLVPRLLPLLDPQQLELLEPGLIEFVGPEDFQHKAAIALWRITGRPQPTVRVLAATFGMSVIESADCLAEIGPEAREALPMLRAYLPKPWPGERRPTASPWHDIKLVKACARAITRIEGAS